jgi:hypothetical protein
MRFYNEAHKTMAWAFPHGASFHDDFFSFQKKSLKRVFSAITIVFRQYPVDSHQPRDSRFLAILPLASSSYADPAFAE